MIGLWLSASLATRSSVCPKRLPIAGKDMNCLGSERLLAGHSRVPDPPERMTGLMVMIEYRCSWLGRDNSGAGKDSDKRSCEKLPYPGPVLEKFG
jgi:hypothetical protein